MNQSRIFILRPIATSLLMVALLLAGIVAYQFLPVSSLPEVDYPTIQVATFYPGASPDVMASSITAPLERQFGQMAGLNQMTSGSSSGSSLITLQFSLEVSLDVAEQEVQAAINAAMSYLPRDLPNPPIYSKVNPADTPIMTLALSAKTLPMPQVEDFAESRLAPKISQLPGVGLVSISGGQRPAVRIGVNLDTVAAYGLDLEAVRNSINLANVNAAKGSFDGSRLAYTINANDQLLTAADYRPLILAYKNATPLRLSDVARTHDGAENTQQAAWMNTRPAVIVNIQRQPGANVIAVVDRIKQLLPQLQASLPRAISLAIIADRTITVRASVRDVQFELVLAIILVMLVIFVFLRNIPATLIPSVAVPLSLIGTFGVMYLCDFSLNNLTLMGLTIVTGFVVDDAIVMIENISRYIEQGDSSLQAALKGSAQIGFTIMSLTVSLIAVLIPLLFMGEVIGRLFREFAVTVAVTILISAVVSLTLTPMLCSRLLHHRPLNEAGRIERFAAQSVEHLLVTYRVSLQWVLARQNFILVIATLTLLLTSLLFYWIPKGFFPLQDTGIIQGVSEAAQSVSFPAMAQRQQALARIILQDPAVVSLSSFIGIDGSNPTLNSGRMLIILKPLTQRTATASEVIRRLQPQLQTVPGITLFMQAVQDLTLDDRVSRTQYQYSLSSPDAAQVTLWSQQFVKKLQQLPQLRDVTSDQQNLGLQALVKVDRDTAARFGISMQLIDNILYDAFGQRQVSTMYTQRNQYHVVLEAAQDLQQGPAAFEHLYITAPSGVTVPLRAFTQISYQVAPLIINRQGQFPVATISFNLAPHISLGEAVQAIEQAKRDIAMPLGVQTNFEGAAKLFQSSLANEGWLVLAAIVVVYIVLGVLYESYIHPITILSTLPSAGLGALLALILAKDEFSVVALIGIILLIGIVMKNAIMMIDFALDNERTYAKTPAAAIFEACLLRFRPILMTTLASMLGAVPLAFGGGMGTELRRPLGIVIIGGLLVSQLLTLYTTPVIYLAFDRLSRAFRSNEILQESS